MRNKWEPVENQLMHKIDSFYAQYGHNPSSISLSEERYLELWSKYHDLLGCIQPKSDRDGIYIMNFINIPVYLSKDLKPPQDIILGSIPKLPITPKLMPKE